MTERRRTPLLLAPLLALLVPAAAVAAYVVLGPSGNPTHDRRVSGTGTSAVVYQGSTSKPTAGTPASDNGKGPVKDFDVRLGSFSPLYPGASTPIRVTVTNPQSFEIEVDNVAVSATGSGACSSAYLVTGSYPQSVHVIVPAKLGTEVITVPFGMKPSAPNSCQGKPFVVTVTATAVKK